MVCKWITVRVLQNFITARNSVHQPDSFLIRHLAELLQDLRMQRIQFLQDRLLALRWTLQISISTDLLYPANELTSNFICESLNIMSAAESLILANVISPLPSALIADSWNAIKFLSIALVL
jgi:hypothetical protein